MVPTLTQKDDSPVRCRRERNGTGAVRFSSRSTQRVINPKATGWVERKHLPFHPRPRPGLLRQKRPHQSSGGAHSPRAAESRPGTGQGLELPGVCPRCGRPAARRPPRSPLPANGSPRSGDGGARGGGRTNQAPRAARGEERGGEAGGDGGRATSTAASHLGMRGQLPHLPHVSGGAREESLELFSPPPHTAPSAGGEAAESPSRLWPSFYVVCREEGSEGDLGAGELTSGLAGLRAGRAEAERRGAAGIHAGAMDRAALLGLSRLCALWAALLALFPCGAQGNWM